MAGRFLKFLGDSFAGKAWEKAGEKAVDLVMETAKARINFDFNLQHLEKNFKRLEDVASDVETTIRNQELHGRKKRKREVEKWLDTVQEMVQEMGTDCRKLQKEVEEHRIRSCLVDPDRVLRLNARVEELIEQSQNFGELLVLDACEARGEQFLKTKLFGREEVLDRILECLAIDRVPSQIGIHGVSGVGKTALAKHINNVVLEKTHRVYWVRVSQDFNVKKLQDQIARGIGLSLSGEDIEETRASALHRVLTQRKDFVLILDDVWEDISLERVGYPLGVDGCRLIITTPSLKVCHLNGCQENFELKPLEFDGAWNLFKETHGNVTMLSEEVKEIAKSITRGCDGLPQKIIAVAQTMRGVNQIQEWRNALLELGE